MTDKQIIIDGVDVSRCEKLMQGIVPFGCIEDRKTCSCMNNPNCLYKQLKRAENQIVDLNKIVDAKEQECDQLKAENEELKELSKLLEEQMKFNKSKLELSLSSEVKRSKFLLNEFKKADKQRDNWREKAEKLKQTLIEIKEITEE